jgi:hypothetical protein
VQKYRHCSFLKLFADREGLTDTWGNTVISFAGCIVDQRLDFHDIQLTILTKYIFVTFYIDYLTDELGMQTNLDSIQQTAFQHYRKFIRIQATAKIPIPSWLSEFMAA